MHWHRLLPLTWRRRWKQNWRCNRSGHSSSTSRRSSSSSSSRLPLHYRIDRDNGRTGVSIQQGISSPAALLTFTLLALAVAGVIVGSVAWVQTDFALVGQIVGT